MTMGREPVSIDRFDGAFPVDGISLQAIKSLSAVGATWNVTYCTMNSNLIDA